jgi:hypothetical protein
LKSAIVEEPFRPQEAAASEVLRGIGAQDFPPLQGYVATTPKPRAETPLLTDKGDPLLAHWQFGLGRAVAFTSDAKSRWARDWLSWEKYRQFWSQIAQWTLRRVENEEFTTDVSIDKGEGVLTVEAVDREGNYRNFLHLQAVVVSPKGERQTVLLEQTGPGHYEARFPTKEVGAYLLNLLNLRDGQVAGAQVLGASLNYSPEFSDAQPNLNLLRRLTEAAGGKLLDPRLAADHPFAHDRHKTFQPHDLVEWLLKLAVVLFTLDVGVRRVQIDRTEWLRFLTRVQRKVFFGRGLPRPPEAEESLAALLARRQTVRASQTAPGTPVVPGRSELLEPAHAPPDSPSAGAPTPPEAPASPSAPAPATPPEPPPASTASRLLEAKRRAQQRRK